MKANQKTKFDFIEEINSFGIFNGWKGFIGLYFTKAEVKQMNKYGVTEDHTIKEAYDILNKYEDIR